MPVDDYVVDIVRGELLIEVQTGGFYPVRDKIRKLAEERRVRLVHPLPRDKWLIKLPPDGEGEPERRKSPKHCSPVHIFRELIRMPRLLVNPNFSLHVLLVEMEEVRRYEAGRAFARHGWLVQERRLIDVVEPHLFDEPEQMAGLLPPDMDEPFTTADLSDHADIRRSLAQKACYCLRKMNAVEQVGRCGNAHLYRVAE